MERCENCVGYQSLGGEAAEEGFLCRVADEGRLDEDSGHARTAQNCQVSTGPDTTILKLWEA